MNRRRLPLKDRRLGRRLSRDSYREADSEESRKILMEAKLQSYGLDPWTIATLLVYAIKLWLWWRERRVDDPSETPMIGEPKE